MDFRRDIDNQTISCTNYDFVSVTTNVISCVQVETDPRLFISVKKDLLSGALNESVFCLRYFFAKLCRVSDWLECHEKRKRFLIMVSLWRFLSQFFFCLFETVLAWFDNFHVTASQAFLTEGTQSTLTSELVLVPITLNLLMPFRIFIKPFSVFSSLPGLSHQLQLKVDYSQLSYKQMDNQAHQLAYSSDFIKINKDISRHFLRSRIGKRRKKKIDDLRWEHLANGVFYLSRIQRTN